MSGGDYGQMRIREDRKVTIATLDQNYGVYVLRCRSRDPEFVNDYAMDILGKAPDWAEEAAQYENLYYIGSSGNVIQRVGQHLNGRGADFTKLFPAEALMEIRLCSNRDLALEVEASMEDSYRTFERRYCYYS